MARCVKMLSSGKRCKAKAMKGQKYCLFHSTKNGGLKSSQRGGGKPFRNGQTGIIQQRNHASV